VIAERADRAILDALQSGLGHWEKQTGAALDPPALTRSQIQRLMDEGRIRADGTPLKASAKLTPGARVEILIPSPRPLDLQPEERPLEFLYEDEHLLVVNKPQGLTVHPSETQMEGTLVHALLHHVKDLSGIGGVLRPGIVHRIDKDTSGALVITKTDAAHAGLSEVFARHEIERSYWALCYGAPKTPREGLKIETLIGRSPADRKKMSTQVKEGRRAMTWIRMLEAYGLPSKAAFASLIEARLETGRTHQVRVHLTSIHHSILADPVYGVPTERQPKWTALPRDVQERVRALPGQALHARTLGFKHPITGEELRFTAEPPEAFRLLLETLRRRG
jgi:23S rRNA pseudouridine1911/1915/1917 synthase